MALPAGAQNLPVHVRVTAAGRENVSPSCAHLECGFNRTLPRSPTIPRASRVQYSGKAPNTVTASCFCAGRAHVKVGGALRTQSCFAQGLASAVQMHLPSESSAPQQRTACAAPSAHAAAEYSRRQSLCDDRIVLKGVRTIQLPTDCAKQAIRSFGNDPTLSETAEIAPYPTV
eukprot:775733-Prymnesium_polylepis.1